MSAYHPPNHNRLLDLEDHLRHQQTGAIAPRQRPGRQSIQRRQPYRQLVNKQRTPRTQKQPERQPPQAFSHQQRSPVGKAPLSRQSKRNQAQSGANRAVTAPQNPRPGNGDRSAGSYRQLATEMGKYYSPRKPVTRTPNNDLPVIPTPISQEVVESFAAPMPPKRKQRPIPSPAGLPASPSTNPPPQPKCQGLAKTIRQARLRITNSEPKATAHMRGESQHRDMDWSIDEVLTKDLEIHGPASDEVSEPAETSRSLFDKPMIRMAQDKTSVQNVPQEGISPAKDRHGHPGLFARAPSSPVTIDVTPVGITSDEANRAAPTTTMFSQDLDMAIAIQVEEASLDQTAEAEGVQTNSRPTDGNASAPEMNGPEDDTQAVESPSPSADSDAVPMDIKSRVLQFYQLAYRPQIEKYLTQFRHKIQQLKETHGQG